MSLEMRNCLDCHGLFPRKSGHIRCALCHMVHENQHYRSTVGKVRPDDRGLTDNDFEVRAVAEQRRAAELWFNAMRGIRWDVKRKDGQG